MSGEAVAGSAGQPCPLCEGSGQLPDQARQARTEARRALARERLAAGMAGLDERLRAAGLDSPLLAEPDQTP